MLTTPRFFMAWAEGFREESICRRDSSMGRSGNCGPFALGFQFQYGALYVGYPRGTRTKRTANKNLQCTGQGTCCEPLPNTLHTLKINTALLPRNAGPRERWVEPLLHDGVPVSALGARLRVIPLQRLHPTLNTLCTTDTFDPQNPNTRRLQLVD